MRNESTNDRLVALENQMKILSSSKSCDETGSPSNHHKTSEKQITDSNLLIGKTAKPLENRPDSPKGESHSIVMNLNCSRTHLAATYLFHDCIHMM